MIVRLALRVEGVVQGVGFRPATCRLAREMGVAGFVRNGGAAVDVEAEGETLTVQRFVDALFDTAASATVTVVGVLAPLGEDVFVISASRQSVPEGIPLPPDRAPCAQCLVETFSPDARRYRYPFTSCTRCGPRWSIALAAPWDHARTTLRLYSRCRACKREFRALDDRRAHAQTLFCPDCGPRLWLEEGTARLRDDAALRRASALLREGFVVALKGVGGWQLVADATREEAVARLRARKRREAKPFAVLFEDLAAVERCCVLDPNTREALTSAAAPIVLLRTRQVLAPSVAPDSPYTGAMLPASPLHALLARDCGAPLVCTSGNVADVPLCVEDEMARVTLGPIADALLGHERRIARPLDDSVLRVASAGPVVLRRARGLTPTPLARHEPGAVVLAFGAHLKATVTLALRREYLVSQHVGDLTTPEALDRLAATARELLGWTGARPDAVACDLHPDYASTQLAETFAQELGVPIVRVQHHAAHLGAIAAEHGLADALHGFTWDGLGLGDDRTLWGGEALRLDGSYTKRIARLRPFPLPGGEAAVREPRRAALGLLLSLGIALDPVARYFSRDELTTLARCAERSINAPLTSSVGRLFDAVAALLGLVGRARYEAEGAMRLEGCCVDEPLDVAPLPLPLDTTTQPWTLDTEVFVRALLAAMREGVPVARLAAGVHTALAGSLRAVAAATGARSVALGGGCFQNVRLVDGAARVLSDDGVALWTARALPPGDGGISVGQALLAARRLDGDVSGGSR